MPELLLEIGFEEMPAGWLPGLADQLRQRFLEATTKQHLAPGEPTVFWTPRRLVLAAELVRRQEDTEARVFGPAVKAAKDPSGAWTKAALGFARKCGVEPESLAEGPKDPSKPKQIHLLHVKTVAGRETGEVLPGVLAGLLRGLAFPKRMAWDAWLDDGKGAFPFGRPIRWLLVLFDGSVVPFEIHSMNQGARGEVMLRSGDRTCGHRFLPRDEAERTARVSSLGELAETLRGRFVILDPDERARRIQEGLAGHDARAAGDHPLIEEWRDLVEYPTVVRGRIPEQFQDLPEAVLRTVLVHHQKYVPLEVDGRQAGFAAVTNTDAEAAESIVQGMERVVVARLRDGAFFYQEDLKRSMADRVADLEGVVFHRALGSYADKAARIERLAGEVFELTGLGQTPECAAAREAARLAKADLTTLMVGEFPELQGVMGGIYLRAQQPDADSAVADAVRWHYHPLAIGVDDAPAGELAGSARRVFAAVSLADKLDTLVGYFGIDEVPTGSRDPYGLRRAAQGGLRVLLDFWEAEDKASRPDLRRLIETATDAHGDRLTVAREDLETSLRAFLLDRLEFLLVSREFPLDEVRAVVHTPGADALEDPRDCLIRLRALNRVRSEAREDFDQLAAAFKRASNILRNQPPGPVKPKLFTEAEERDLHAAVERVGGVDGGYEVRLRALAGLRGPVDRFFDGVMVMAEEPDIRSNRLGLLAEALSLFYRIADISRLGG